MRADLQMLTLHPVPHQHRLQRLCPCMQAINHLAASRAALTLPIYAVHGTRDAVTSLQASVYVCAGAPA